MDLTMIDPIWWIVLGAVVLLLVGLLVWSGRRTAHRTNRLKSQFKSEYDRTTSSSSRKKAEDDLERRNERHRGVALTDIDESDAEDMQQHLDELPQSFVDEPQAATLGMTQLVGRIAAARGYVTTEGNVIDLVSVDHPEQVAAMRRSEAEIDKAKGAGRTEASRQTFLDARALAERLLAEGRAGHVKADASEPEAREPVSDIEDTPPPTWEHEEAPDAEPTREARATWTSRHTTPDRRQAGTTTGGTPRR